MDPITVPALAAVLSKVFDGAAGEAGKQAWDSLTKLVGRMFGKSAADAVAQIEGPGGAVTVVGAEALAALAEALAAETETDPMAARLLAGWMDDTAQALASPDQVTNIVTGNVHGNVIQARDIHGGIHL